MSARARYRPWFGEERRRGDVLPPLVEEIARILEQTDDPDDAFDEIRIDGRQVTLAVTMRCGVVPIGCEYCGWPLEGHVSVRLGGDEVVRACPRPPRPGFPLEDE